MAAGRTGRSGVSQRRTTKTTQKLVLFPDDASTILEPLQLVPDDRFTTSDIEPDAIVADRLASYGTTAPDVARTHAERQTKEQRRDLPRVTCFCVAESFKMEGLGAFFKDKHATLTKMYDECMYFYYEPAMKAAAFYPHGTGDRSNTVSTPQTDEVFIFDYGVVVFWNFTSDEEQKLLAMVEPFASGGLKDDDIEIEDFHFQYDLLGPHQPRIFNDMITLKSSNPLIKLTISHGLAQSVKLALFENIMETTIYNTTPLPRMMAKYGTVKMSRVEIMKIVGQLFKLKMNVNLISNVL
eukprot:jgi/Hompol1/1336/HPOL_003245-RA